MDNLGENHEGFLKINKLILKSHGRWRSQKRHEFTGEVNKIALSDNNVKRKQSINSIETYGYGAWRSSL